MNRAVRHVSVSATGKGIGKACPLAFHQQGAMLVATDLDSRAVNGVGLVTGDVLQCSLDDWNRSLLVNATSFYNVTCAVLPGRAAYGAAKAAVIGLTKSVAADFAADIVRCNAVCPGPILTRPLRHRIATSGGEVGGTARSSQCRPANAVLLNPMMLCVTAHRRNAATGRSSGSFSRNADVIGQLPDFLGQLADNLLPGAGKRGNAERRNREALFIQDQRRDNRVSLASELSRASSASISDIDYAGRHVETACTVCQTLTLPRKTQAVKLRLAKTRHRSPAGWHRALLAFERMSHRAVSNNR